MSAHLKNDLDKMTKRIELQIQKLDTAIERFTQRDKSLFARVLDALGKHDMARAKVFANEVTEVRKMEKLILRSRGALRQILSNLKNLRLIEAASSPAVVATATILRVIRFQLVEIFPEACSEIEEIRKMLSAIIVEVGDELAESIDFKAARTVANKTMAEVDKTVDQEMKNRFPDLPAGVKSPPTSPQHGSDEGST